MVENSIVGSSTTAAVAEPSGESSKRDEHEGPSCDHNQIPWRSFDASAASEGPGRFSALRRGNLICWMMKWMSCCVIGGDLSGHYQD